jgi:hypothetical protein
MPIIQNPFLHINSARKQDLFNHEVAFIFTVFLAFATTLWVAALVIGVAVFFTCHAQENFTNALQSSVVWSPSPSPGAQAYVAFLRSFVLNRVPESAQLNLFADSRYLLWVNGTNILRGPCRFNPKRPEFDTLELRPFLQPGTNLLAVLVHSYPALNGRIMRHAPGLTALQESK